MEKNTMIEVSRDVLVPFLEGFGFKRDKVAGQVVYSRQDPRNPRLRMVVYTTIPEFHETAVGAIRVEAQIEQPGLPGTVRRYERLYGKNVLRVGTVAGVLERVEAAFREALGACGSRLGSMKTT